MKYGEMISKYNEIFAIIEDKARQADSQSSHNMRMQNEYRARERREYAEYLRSLLRELQDTLQLNI